MINNKLKELKKFSNPNIVFRKAKEMFGRNVKIQISTRDRKKYMIFLKNKWIHFGEMNYQDYTKHRDERRRRLFLIRNHTWKNKRKNTPAYLSYYLLW